VPLFEDRVDGFFEVIAVGLSALVRPLRSRALREVVTSEGTDYDAFVSYSHAADGQLAPALQAGLQSLGKPWYRRRVLRVFRDKTSLSASPELWPSIERALAASRYFVLLASPEAAASRWVDQEVRWWLEHRSPATMLIGLTGGDLAWDDARGAFDQALSTALPPAALGWSGKEPLWVDLRWVRETRHVSLRDPRFREVVADLAAPVRGLPKDELVGEDVRQHRRTVRLVRLAVTLLTVLALFAGSSAIFAVGQWNTAERRARLALSRQLAAQANLTFGQQYDLGLLLALGASKVENTLDAQSSLLAGLSIEPRITTFVHGHNGRVLGAAYSHDDRVLVSGSEDGTVVGSDAGTGRSIYEPLRIGPASSMAFSRGGRLLVAGKRDGTIVLWDTEDRKQVGHALRGCQLDGFVKNPAIDRLTFSHDGSAFASACIDQATVVVWSAQQRLRLGTPFEIDGLSSIALHPKGTLLAASDLGGMVYIWDVRTHKMIQRLHIQDDVVVTALTFSLDGRTIIMGTANSNIVSWDLQRGKPGAVSLRGGNGPQPSILLLNADGRMLANARVDGSVILWDLKSGERMGEPLSGVGTIESLALSNSGRRLTTGSMDGHVVLWEPARQDRLGQLISRRFRAQEGGVAFSPDGKTLAWAEEETGIALWDVERGQPMGHFGEGEAIAFSSNGALLAIAQLDNVVVWNLQPRRRVRTIHLPVGSVLGGIAFSPDSRTLAWSESSGMGGQVVLLDLGDGRRVAELPVPPDIPQNRLLTFSPDGQMLVGQNSNALRPPILWDVARRRRLTEPFLGDKAISMAFAHKKKMVAVGTEDGRIEFWDVASRQRLGEPIQHGNDRIANLAFSPDDKVLASTNIRNVTLWDAESRQRLGEPLPHPSGNVWTDAIFSPSDRTLVSADSKDLFIWRLSESALRKQACGIVGRNFTESEWRRFVGTTSRYQTVC
jgi:WD40 repeat protein